MDSEALLKWIISIKTLILNADKWNIADIVALLSLFLAIIGSFFVYRQWLAANQIKRTEFISQIIEKLRFDKDLVKTMDIIDYGDSWYNAKFHHQSELEFEMDKLLSYLSYICYIYETKNIGTKEFKILRYELHRTCSSHAVQSYLWNLYHFSKKSNSNCAFHYLIDYGIKNGLIEKVKFKNKDSNEYPKYLNF